jgi:hypothetical protein
MAEAIFNVTGKANRNPKLSEAKSASGGRNRRDKHAKYANLSQKIQLTDLPEKAII